MYSHLEPKKEHIGFISIWSENICWNTTFPANIFVFDKL